MGNDSQHSAQQDNAYVDNYSPYRSLQAFEFEHADYFFGRQQAILQALSALDKQVHGRISFALTAFNRQSRLNCFLIDNSCRYCALN